MPRGEQDEAALGEGTDQFANRAFPVLLLLQYPANRSSSKICQSASAEGSFEAGTVAGRRNTSRLDSSSLRHRRFSKAAGALKKSTRPCRRKRSNCFSTGGFYDDVVLQACPPLHRVELSVGFPYGTRGRALVNLLSTRFIINLSFIIQPLTENVKSFQSMRR